MIGRQLRANPPRDSSLGDVCRDYHACGPLKEPGRGWSGNVRTDAKLQAATKKAIHASRNHKEAPAATRRECPRYRARGKGGCHSDEGK